MYKLTENALNKVGTEVSVIVPVSLFSETKKTVYRILHKRQAFGMTLLYIHYSGLELFVTESKKGFIIL